jgi:hypothetical protein
MARTTVAPKETKTQLPEGWFLSGATPKSYEAATDTSVFRSGKQSTRLSSTDKHPGNGTGRSRWSTLMTQMNPSTHVGKRVRMTVWLKTAEVEGWVCPWMRVDGTTEMLSFDNMCTSQIKSTIDWTEFTIVLDVPSAATNIAFGVMLGGLGKVWMDEVVLEEVDADVAATDCPCITRSKKSRQVANGNEKAPQRRFLPKGWTTRTLYEQTRCLYSAGVDNVVTYKGKKAACIEVTESDYYAKVQLYQILRCEGWRGKRVRVSVQLKSQDVKVKAGFWLDVIGPHEGTLACDDMENRQIFGTTNWKKYEIVVDVPMEAVELHFGACVQGSGILWFANLSIEEVGLDIQITDDYSNGCRGIWWKTPINTDFLTEEESQYRSQSSDQGVIPKGWLTYASPMHGYEIGAAVSGRRAGTRSACIQARGERNSADNAFIFQKFDGKVYRGKRVRLTAFTKTEGISDQCGLRLMVMDSNQRELFSEDAYDFDSAVNHDWVKREIVVQIPQQAGVLMIYFELFGGGTAWMDQPHFEVVDEDVLLTKTSWKAIPRNLDFSEVWS